MLVGGALLHSSSLFDNRYIGFGFSNYESKNLDFIAGFDLEIGVIFNNSKIFVSFPEVSFSNKNKEELEIESYSINYNYLLTQYKNSLSPYVGVGLSYTELKMDNTNKQQAMG